MKIVSLIAFIAVSISGADICSDLVEIGVPAGLAFLMDSMLVVEMSGSLSEGDSLLKHYGGIFYTAVDSILAGWDVIGIAVRLDEATLVFRREDMLRMFDWISETTEDEAIAEWVLNHTRVIREEGSL
jgi:hypothetical protein